MVEIFEDDTRNAGLKRLREFVRRGEGKAPPVFVGRESVLDDIRQSSADSWKEWTRDGGGTSKATRIIQGAPGAGKTSLLDRMRMGDLGQVTGEDGKRVSPRVLVLGTGGILGPENILGPLAEMLAPGENLEERFRETARQMFGSFRISGKQWKPAESDMNWNVFKTWIDDWSGGTGPSGPIIIAIDEAQRLTLDKTHPVARLLQGIHHGKTGLPMALVLAGLCDTQDRASEMDLTRGPDPHGIGALEPDEVKVLLRKFCREFGLDATGLEGRLEGLVQPCEGWPRHLHFAMQALGRGALMTGGDMARVNWEAVEAEAAESRPRYYGKQQSRKMKRSKGLVADVMSEVPGARDGIGVEEGAILRAIARNARGDFEHALPKGMDMDEFFDHLVHQGALLMRDDDTFHCPIPSFRRYLVKAGGLGPDARPGATGDEASPTP